MEAGRTEAKACAHSSYWYWSLGVSSVAGDKTEAANHANQALPRIVKEKGQTTDCECVAVPMRQLRQTPSILTLSHRSSRAYVRFTRFPGTFRALRESCSARKAGRFASISPQCSTLSHVCLTLAPSALHPLLPPYKYAYAYASAQLRLTATMQWQQRCTLV